jgi:hypothetical protein
MPLTPKRHWSAEGRYKLFLMMILTTNNNSFICFPSQRHLCSNSHSLIQDEEYLVQGFHVTWSYWQRVREACPNIAQANWGCAWATL